MTDALDAALDEPKENLMDVVVERLRPSEALRMGATKYPRQTFELFAEPGGPDGWAVCALGAIAAGRGWNPSADAGLIDSYTDDLDRQGGDCPESHTFPIFTSPLTSLVIHLNDDHRWSFEEIAAYLESIGQ